MGPLPGGSGDGLGSLLGNMLPFLLMFLVLYFLIIRPQQKRQRQHQEMMDQLKNGDRVVTSGGMLGTVAGIRPDIVVLRVADNVKIEVQKSAVSKVLVKKGDQAEEE
ncbi:MAG: preprotein translocase subunit YajC [Candidatus Latescibacteria bacterium]|nr:preprotein translocase subunit YajC [Candidatus Latescibacterota bacterium]